MILFLVWPSALARACVVAQKLKAGLEKITIFFEKIENIDIVD